MTPEQRRRQDIRPGLSVWAQINGRNSIEWEDKLNYDLEYLDKISFLDGRKDRADTIKKVFKTESISYEGIASAEDLGEYLLELGNESRAVRRRSRGSKRIIEIIKV